MAPIDTAILEKRRTAPADLNAPWELDAPWILDPPSRLSFPAEEETRRSGLRRALAERLSGPGGYYNVGNALGLFGGIAIAVAAADETAGGIDAVYAYLAGSPSAVWLTIAMLIFFCGGEAYHRAWAGGFPPDPRLNRRGDLFSGYGCVALGIGLFLVAEPLLAVTAGGLSALGKFGSAFYPARPGVVRRWPDPCRAAVVLSRIPALAVVTLALAAEFSEPGGADALDLAMPALLLVCYLLWARADLLLFRS